MKRYLLLLLVFVAFVTGCRPTEVVVRERPVAPVYVRPVSPRAGYVWVEGEWVWTSRGYTYRQGYWAAPRYHGATYKPGHWRHSRRGWVWVPGRW